MSNVLIYVPCNSRFRGVTATIFFLFVLLVEIMKFLDLTLITPLEFESLSVEKKTNFIKENPKHEYDSTCILLWKLSVG